MIIVFSLFGIIFSVCALNLLKPLLTYQRLEIRMIYFLEWLKLICCIVIFVRALL
jgi:multisubunit Na+/H+ antiporter MnhE subunit